MMLSRRRQDAFHKNENFQDVVNNNNNSINTNNNNIKTGWVVYYSAKPCHQEDHLCTTSRRGDL